MNTEAKQPYSIRIATYNIGDFSGDGFLPGSEEAKSAFKRAMASVGASLWALQEDIYWFGGVKELSPYDAIYSDYPYYKREYTGEYNGKAFLSRFPIEDAARVEYVGVGRFRHPWYLRGFTELGGRRVQLICLHFDWSDKHVRAQQITQVIEAAKSEEYTLILGDFNPENYINDGERLDRTLLHEAEIARFTEAGFAAANGGAFGYFDTIARASISPCPFDNIFVSPGITLDAVGKLEEPWMNDHALLWADITLH